MPICTVCGGRRIPVPGLRLHPNCYPTEAQLWPAAERAAYMAARSTTNTPAQPPQTAQGAPGGNR
jgi:hypothetical protein